MKKNSTYGFALGGILAFMLMFTGFVLAQNDSISGGGFTISQLNLSTWLTLALGIWDVIARVIPTVNNNAPTHRVVQFIVWLSNFLNRKKNE